MVTFAPATAAPWVSETVPMIRPFVFWAKATVLNTKAPRAIAPLRALRGLGRRLRSAILNPSEVSRLVIAVQTADEKQRCPENQKHRIGSAGYQGDVAMTREGSARS